MLQFAFIVCQLLLIVLVTQSLFQNMLIISSSSIIEFQKINPFRLLQPTSHKTDILLTYAVMELCNYRIYHTEKMPGGT